MSCNIKTNTLDFLKEEKVIDNTRKILDHHKMEEYNKSLTKRAFNKYGVGDGSVKLFTIEEQHLPVGKSSFKTVYRAVANNKLFDILDEAVNFNAIEGSIQGRFKLENEDKSSQPKEGVIEFFEDTPQLNKLGTSIQYSQYLESIFPKTKVDEIVYHGTANPVKIEEFKLSKDRLYFTDKATASSYAAWDQTNREQHAAEENVDINQGLTLIQVIHAIINLESPVLLEGVNFRETETNKEGDGIIGTNIIDPLNGRETQYVIRNTDQVHILGTKNDVEGFEKYIKNNIKEEKSLEDFFKEEAPIMFTSRKQQREINTQNSAIERILFNGEEIKESYTAKEILHMLLH